MRASVIACSTVPGPDSGSVCQPCTHWPSGMLGCWARSLAGCYTPACGDLSGYSAYLSLSYLSAFICLLTCLVTSYWQPLLSFWQTTLLAVSMDVCRPVAIFFAFPPACQCCCRGCPAVTLSSLLLFFCLSICPAACLVVWLPNRGMSGKVLDNKHPADRPLTRTEAWREGERKRGGRRWLWQMKGEINGEKGGDE